MKQSSPLGLLLLGIFWLQPLAHAVPTQVAESALTVSDPEPKRWSLSTGLFFPANLFSLTGKVEPTSSGAKNWTANFVPSFAPILSITGGYDGLSLTYSHKVFSRQNFDSIRLGVPVGNWMIAFSWQDFRGMDQQLTLKDAADDTSEVSFDSGAPYQRRDDVGFFSTTFGVNYRPPLFTINLKSDDGVTSVPFDLGWFAGGDFLYQSFSADSAFIPNVHQGQFGPESNVSGLRQGGVGANLGLILQAHVTARSLALLDLGAGYRFLLGSAAFGQSREASSQFSPHITSRLGWAYRGQRHLFSTDLLLEASSGSVGALKLAPFHLAAGASYGVLF